MIKRLFVIALGALLVVSPAAAEDLRTLMQSRTKMLSQQQLQTIVVYLKQNPQMVDSEIRRLYGSGTNTPLNEALSLGDVGLVSVLLEYGADPNKASGRTEARPLQWALNDTLDPSKIADSVALLIAKGANPNLTDKRHSTALDTWAARRSWCETPSYEKIGVVLFDAGAQIEGDSKASGTPLMIAVVNSNPVATKMLLEKGASPDREALLGTARGLAKKEASRNTARPEARTVLSLIEQH